ncbi:hypothetical protein BKG75_17630 [Mycobacteroides chelonae]|nr:hypothetical protein BKG75_17630 [Mycobacteroides chelonae]
MAHKVIHAPDGGSIPNALCEEPTGDVSTFESDIDCPECLDGLEEGERTFAQLVRPVEDFWSPDRHRPQRAPRQAGAEI